MNGFTGFVDVDYIGNLIVIYAYLDGRAGETAVVFPEPRPLPTGDKPIKGTEGEYQITFDGRLIPLTDRLIISRETMP